MSRQLGRRIIVERLITLTLVLGVFIVVAANFWRTHELRKLDVLNAKDSINVTIEAYVFNDSGERQPYSTHLKKKDQTIILQATPNQEGFFALLQFFSDGSIERIQEQQFLFQNKLQVMRQGDDVFRFRISDSLAIYRFCLLGFPENTALAKAVELIKDGMTYSIEGSCTTL